MTKYSKREVNFEHPAKGPHHCASCQFFEPAHQPEYTCEKVDGVIRPGDWCKLWRHERYPGMRKRK